MEKTKQQPESDTKVPVLTRGNSNKHEIDMKFFRQEFHWVIYGICVAALLFILIAAYLITRIVDGNWADWKLPVIMVISWLVLVIVGAMLFSLRDIKREISVNNKN